MQGLLLYAKTFGKSFANRKKVLHECTVHVRKLKKESDKQFHSRDPKLAAFLGVFLEKMALKLKFKN